MFAPYERRILISESDDVSKPGIVVDGVTLIQAAEVVPHLVFACSYERIECGDDATHLKGVIFRELSPIEASNAGRNRPAEPKEVLPQLRPPLCAFLLLPECFCKPVR